MIKKEVVAFNSPKSPISEVFRALRTNIQFINSRESLKTILVTSTLPGEGKSWVASNLAVTFAQAGKKVLVIDADLRRGRQHVMFGASPTPGLSNYLTAATAGETELNLSDFIQPVKVKNLYIITAGTIDQKTSELLFSMSMKDLLEKLKKIFDIILIDGTPCKLVTDSVILSRIVDSTLVVTAANQTKREELDRVVKNIRSVGGKIDGIVLNKMPITLKDYSAVYSADEGAIGRTKKVEKTSKVDDERMKLKEERKIEHEKVDAEKMNSEKILQQLNEYMKNQE